ncbi:MAG: hypothetical protein GY866_27095 [Proteobacteria bacterium]|nr:hypothetical protein [Pseudomonadota bacterium]
MIISLVTKQNQRLYHPNYLDLWKEESSRDPPVQPNIPDQIVYAPVEDSAWEQQESPGFSGSSTQESLQKTRILI